jgi:hypothetical protein
VVENKGLREQGDDAGGAARWADPKANGEAERLLMESEAARRIDALKGEGAVPGAVELIKGIDVWRELALETAEKLGEVRAELAERAERCARLADEVARERAARERDAAEPIRERLEKDNKALTAELERAKGRAVTEARRFVDSFQEALSRHGLRAYLEIPGPGAKPARVALESLELKGEPKVEPVLSPDLPLSQDPGLHRAAAGVVQAAKELNETAAGFPPSRDPSPPFADRFKEAAELHRKMTEPDPRLDDLPWEETPAGNPGAPVTPCPELSGPRSSKMVIVDEASAAPRELLSQEPAPEPDRVPPRVPPREPAEPAPEPDPSRCAVSGAALGAPDAPMTATEALIRAKAAPEVLTVAELRARAAILEHGRELGRQEAAAEAKQEEAGELPADTATDGAEVGDVLGATTTLTIDATRPDGGARSRTVLELKRRAIGEPVDAELSLPIGWAGARIRATLVEVETLTAPAELRPGDIRFCPDGGAR